MNQEELGKNEEQQPNASSTELSESSETGAGSNGTAGTTAEAPQSAGTEPQKQATQGPEESGAQASADTAATDDSADADATGTDEDYNADDVGDEDGNTATDQQPDSDDDDAQAQDDSAEPMPFKRGDLLEATIAETSPTELIIDLGDGYQGLVPGKELELMPNRLLEQFTAGAEIAVYVVNPRNAEGKTILSINLALEELDWREAENYRKSKDVYNGKIGGYNKGGLIVRFGQLRGFVPQSQISDVRRAYMEGETPEERYGPQVNDRIAVKVMEVDRQRNRLILSERAAMREVRQAAKENLITELEVGEVRDGVVVSLENFGAFVDIGGAEGLVHITEISWDHITHPRQALDVGDNVQVKVINVDPGQNRIGLSIKQLQPDPWDEIAAEYPAGALLRGTVTKLTKFGAFARIDAKQAVEGLIHISELSEDRVEHPKEVVAKGDELTLRVVKVDVKNRRLGLSLKRVNSHEYLDDDMRRVFQSLEDQVEEQQVEDAVESLIAEQQDDEQPEATEATPEAEATTDTTVEVDIEADDNAEVDVEVTGDTEAAVTVEAAGEAEVEVEAEDNAEVEATVEATGEAEVEVEAEDNAQVDAEIQSSVDEDEGEDTEAEAETEGTETNEAGAESDEADKVDEADEADEDSTDENEQKTD